MLTRRIVPCLDVREGRVVKGVRFRDHVDAGAIEELALRYAQEGADDGDRLAERGQRTLGAEAHALDCMAQAGTQPQPNTRLPLRARRSTFCTSSDEVLEGMANVGKSEIVTFGRRKARIAGVKIEG